MAHEFLYQTSCELLYSDTLLTYFSKSVVISVHYCLQVRPVPEVDVSCDDVVDGGGTEQDTDSLLPFDYADDDEIKSPVLFSSPSFVSNDDDDDDDSKTEVTSHVENIIDMLTADETRSPVHDANGKMMVDKTTETSATWNLDDVDEWLREQQCDVELATSCITDLHQPSLMPSHDSPTDSIQSPAATSSGCVDSENATSFALRDRYFTQSDMELASYLTELHQPSITQPSVVPLYESLLDSAQSPAVTSSGSAGCQNNETETFRSSGQYYCNTG